MSRPVSRALCASLLLLSGLALGQEKSSKPQVSADGVYSIRLIERGEGKCELEVTKDQQPDWTLAKCVGTADDLYFVSTDGRRFWVLKSLGEKPAKSKPSSNAWFKTVVATLYGKDGGVVRVKRVNELVTHRGEVRQLERHFKWLEGVAGVPGRMPRVNDKNEVELEVVGGKAHKLSF